MPSYELHNNAGTINYAEWKDNGIELPVFDKDGTLTNFNSLQFVPDVIEGLKENLVGVYQAIAIVSNNHDSNHFKKFCNLLEDELGIDVFGVCRADGYASKPNPEMGIAVAKNFGLRQEQLGIVGDRRYTDVKFGRKLGAGAIVLCAKVGEGDAKGVPSLRRFERGVIRLEKLLQFAV